MKHPVTYLFVPGDRPDRFDKALAAGADVVILDLEDAVAPSAKAAARRYVSDFVALRAVAADRLAVRINDRWSAEFSADLALLRDAGVRSAILPKAESAEDVALVREMMRPDGIVLPLIETARGVRDVDAVAAAPGIARLVFGTLDFGVDLDLSGDERGLAYAASRIAIASRCANLASPVAGVTASLDDDARLAADLAFARAFGFGAKLCIHPRQVAPVRAAFAPSTAEIEWAQRVVAAAAVAQGAINVDGRMVDRPVVLRAQAILDRASP